MLQKFIISIVISLLCGAFVLAQTPDAGIKPSYIAGEVTAVGDKRFTVNAKTGPMVIIITDKTVFKHASAENPNLTTATPGAITDISVGDKLTVSGILSADGKSLPARSVYYVTKADVAAKNAKESAEWRTRGIKGKVVSVNQQTNQIVLSVPTLTATTNVTLTPKEGAKFLRYADGSIRFDEAKTSTLAQVIVGDEIRALGDKNSDGSAFAAETVLTGAFQTVAGTVVSVDTAKNEVVIKNLQTKKEVTIDVSETSVFKKFPAEMAERMAGAQTFGAGGGTTGPRPVAPAGQAPTGQGQPSGQGQPGRVGFGGRPGGGGGSVDEMLERFPTITAADLKVGDMIAVASTKNNNVARIKAIKFLAGVEPFLRMAQAGNGAKRGQGVDGGFSIPGLDSIGFP